MISQREPAAGRCGGSQAVDRFGGAGHSAFKHGGAIAGRLLFVSAHRIEGKRYMAEILARAEQPFCL